MQEEATTIYCDNQSTMAMAKNPIFHGRTKHIMIKYHFIKEAQKEEVKLVHCCSEVQQANILTKPLSKARFETLRKTLDVSSKSAKEGC